MYVPAILKFCKERREDRLGFSKDKQNEKTEFYSLGNIKGVKYEWKYPKICNIFWKHSWVLLFSQFRWENNNKQNWQLKQINVSKSQKKNWKLKRRSWQAVTAQLLNIASDLIPDRYIYIFQLQSTDNCIHIIHLVRKFLVFQTTNLWEAVDLMPCGGNNKKFGLKFGHLPK